MSTRMELLSSTILVLLLAAPAASLGQQSAERDVVILSPDETDDRVASTREAITFWNQTFAELALRIRLREAEVIVASPAGRALETYARLISQRAGRLAPGAAGPDAPRELADVGGDIMVFLSRQEIMSFAWPVAESTRFFIAIRTDRGPPLNDPNVSRNVIAHELGHALGLTHNGGATALMCGPCQPLVFRSDEPMFFPLTSEDRARLLERYVGR